MAATSEATQILWAINDGDRAGVPRLMELIYDELRRVARHAVVRRPTPLQPTELVHEAYLKLVNQSRSDWRSRSHFVAVAATAMRHVLVDQARARTQQKRGGGAPHLSLEEGLTLSMERDDDILALDAALDALAAKDERRAQMVEFRFFGGLTMDEISIALDTPKRTLEREWRLTRAWLRRHLSGDG